MRNGNSFIWEKIEQEERRIERNAFDYIFIYLKRDVSLKDYGELWFAIETPFQNLMERQHGFKKFVKRYNKFVEKKARTKDNYAN